MTILHAYCGLNCAECTAYIATQNDDLPAKEKLLAEWRVAYNNPDMDIAAVTCDGCTSTGRLGGYCSECAVRACGVERGVVNCAYCPDYGCEKLEAFFAMAPEVRANLEAIRKKI